MKGDRMMELYTPRLELRRWSDADAPDLYAYACDDRVGPAADWPPHGSVEESLEVIRTVFAQPETYAVCLRTDGRPIGCVGFKFGDVSSLVTGTAEAEIGYWLGVPHWGNGLMSEAVAELLRRGFDDLGLETVWGACFEGNHRSSRVLEKYGFGYCRTSSLPSLLFKGHLRPCRIYALTAVEWRTEYYMK